MDKLLNDSALNGDKLFIFSVRRLPGYVYQWLKKK